MPATLSKNLFCACQALFGSEVNATPEFLDYLQPSGLKTAFRKRALESHPDRLKYLDNKDRDLHEEFLTVCNAYELLNQYLLNPQEKIVNCYTSPARKSNPPAKNVYTANDTVNKAKKSSIRKTTTYPSSDFYHGGKIPQRKLLFGEFLYYAGIISWKNMIQAVSWQRMQRPKLGQIAVDLGILSKDDVGQILAGRPWHEKFGEFALRNGYLTSFKLEIIIKKQMLSQKKIGTYFTNNNMITNQSLFHLLLQQRIHNKQW